jgi:hypothetical protein
MAARPLRLAASFGRFDRRGQQPLDAFRTNTLCAATLVILRELVMKSNDH